MTRIAQCHCGQVTITCEGEPSPVVMCSCRLCQRRTGAPFQIGAYFPIEDVRIEGETRPFVSIRDSGLESAVNFCPDCGTSIWWLGFPGKIGVAGGCFADPDFPPPTLSVYEQTKHPWINVPEGVERYEKMPPSERLQIYDPPLEKPGDTGAKPQFLDAMPGIGPHSGSDPGP